jgi:hypothetical protein
VGVVGGAHVGGKIGVSVREPKPRLNWTPAPAMASLTVGLWGDA